MRCLGNAISPARPLSSSPPCLQRSPPAAAERLRRLADEPELVVFAASSLTTAFEEYGERVRGSRRQVLLRGLRRPRRPDPPGRRARRLRRGEHEPARRARRRRLARGTRGLRHQRARDRRAGRLGDRRRRRSRGAGRDDRDRRSGGARRRVHPRGPRRARPGGVGGDPRQRRQQRARRLGNRRQDQPGRGRRRLHLPQRRRGVRRRQSRRSPCPRSVSPDVLYGIAVSTDAAQPELAEEFLRGAVDGPGQDILIDSGFGPVPKR